MAFENLTPFGRKIKFALLEKYMTAQDLINQVSEDTDLYFDRSYLSKIMRGSYDNRKIIDSICKILEIDYE